MDCEICKISFNNKNKKPVLLPCGHCYCFKCVYLLKKEEGDWIKCPSCNEAFDKFSKFPFDEEKMKILDE